MDSVKKDVTRIRLEIEKHLMTKYSSKKNINSKDNMFPKNKLIQ